MKILMVVPYFYPKIGGLENYAFNIAKGLISEYKTDVVVVTSNHRDTTYQIDKVGNIKVYRVPIWFKVSNTPINPMWIFSVQKIITSERPDIINGHTPVPFIADVGGILARFNNIPFVLTYHNDLEKSSSIIMLVFKLYYATLGKFIFYTARKIIASSEYYAQKSPYLKKYSEKIEVVYPGVHGDHFEKKNLDTNKIQKIKEQYKNKKIILFIGQLDKTHRHKGLTYLIEALKQAKKEKPNIHLLIIGRGDNISEYEELSRKLGMGNDISFVGFVKDKDLPYYYNSIDVLVLPSYNASEGFGMVLIEAGAAKKPVIASAVGGIPFVVKDKKTGLLVKPKDSKALVSAIVTILKNEKMAEEMGQENYEWVKEKFTWEKQIDKTYEIFRRLYI